VRGVALDRDQAQLTVTAVPDRPGSAAALCRALADGGISLDTIVQSERQRQSDLGPSRDIAFTLPRGDVANACLILGKLTKQWPGSQVVEGKEIARVSAVGAGMPSTPGTAAKMFKALADRGINIEMIATSEIRVSCIVDQENGVKALNAVHRAFNLEGSERYEAEGTEAPDVSSNKLK